MYTFIIILILILILILIWYYYPFSMITFTDIVVKHPLNIINSDYDILAKANIFSNNEIKLKGTNKIIIANDITLDWDDLFHLKNNYIIGADLKKNNEMSGYNDRLCIGKGDKEIKNIGPKEDYINQKNICINKQNIDELTTGWVTGTIIAFIGQPMYENGTYTTQCGFNDRETVKESDLDTKKKLIQKTTYHTPKGWVICDGNNGTPDLRGKFIKGSNSNIGTTSGSHTRILTDEHIPEHSHTIKINTPADDSGSEDLPIPLKNISIKKKYSSKVSSSETTYYGPSSHNIYDGSNSNLPNALEHNHEPEYYTVIYIMKIKIKPSYQSPAPQPKPKNNKISVPIEVQNPLWKNIKKCCDIWKQVRDNDPNNAELVKCTNGTKVYYCEEENTGWAFPPWGPQTMGDKFNKKQIPKTIWLPGN